MNRQRRTLVLAGATAGWLTLRPLPAGAQPAWLAARDALTGGTTPRPGRVQLEISPLVENGNAVPIGVTVDSPMTTADHVRRIVLLTERNPQPEVAVFTLSPACGRAQVATRIRLATSQTIWALAEEADSRWWQQGVEVIVTLAACVEG